jgi:hypothetical protein
LQNFFIQLTAQKWLPGSTIAAINGGLRSAKTTPAMAGYSTERIAGSLSALPAEKRVKAMILGFPVLGHYVFTLPKEISGLRPDLAQIKALFKLAWKILNEQLEAEAAVICLHFCGDKSHGLHLHFDIAFTMLNRSSEYYIPDWLMKEIRYDWTTGVNQIFKTDHKELVCHYQYAATIGQQHNLIEYMTRSTIPADRFIELSNEEKEYVLYLSKQKIIRYFGKLAGKQRAAFIAEFRCARAAEPTETDPIQLRICPICGGKLKPLKDKDKRLLPLDDVSLSDFIRYKPHIFIDRYISAYLREKEARAEDLSRLDFKDRLIHDEIRRIEEDLLGKELTEC